MQSSQLASTSAAGETTAIARLNAKVHIALEDLTSKVESVRPAIKKNLEQNFTNALEREMAAAAEAIRSAALRLASVKERAPSSSPEDLQVHGAILDTAMAITHAVGNLISCATASQNEIVAQGRGSSTKGAFYKKNNRWMDGLISAAKAVAIATDHLVECADGVIMGTRRMEELIVAGNEVSASVAQLVAASKVFEEVRINEYLLCLNCSFLYLQYNKGISTSPHPLKHREGGNVCEKICNRIYCEIRTCALAMSSRMGGLRFTTILGNEFHPLYPVNPLKATI